jgi:hypothetical protein
LEMCPSGQNNFDVLKWSKQLPDGGEEAVLTNVFDDKVDPPWVLVPQIRPEILRLVVHNLPGWPTIRKLSCWICGTDLSTLEQIPPLCGTKILPQVRPEIFRLVVHNLPGRKACELTNSVNL